MRRLEAEGGSRSVVPAERGLRDGPKGFGIELFASLQGGVDAAFEGSIEGVDVVRGNRRWCFRSIPDLSEYEGQWIGAHFRRLCSCCVLRKRYRLRRGGRRWRFSVRICPFCSAIRSPSPWHANRDLLRLWRGVILAIPRHQTLPSGLCLYQGLLRAG